MSALLQVTLIGAGAISRAIQERVRTEPGLRIVQVVKRGARIEAPTDLIVECAGHSALTEHVIPALKSGTSCALLSIGALAEPGLAEALEAAAHEGGSQVHLLSGAVAGIDALSAARWAGLDAVSYVGRKPPASWKGTPAESICDLDRLASAQILLESTARQAARLYPKNANVAATVSLAGLGLDQTRATLIADPGVTDNIHEIVARGSFGEMQIRIQGKPLPDNPKSSALTVLCAVRFLCNRVRSLAI